jgi:hypothetical protein
MLPWVRQLWPIQGQPLPTQSHGLYGFGLDPVVLILILLMMTRSTTVLHVEITVSIFLQILVAHKMEKGMTLHLQETAVEIHVMEVLEILLMIPMEALMEDMALTTLVTLLTAMTTIFVIGL